MVFWSIRLFLPASSRNRRRLITRTCCAAVICFALPLHAQDLRIVRSTAQELILEFIPHYFAADTLRADGQSVILPHFQNESPFDGSRPGAPDMRSRSVALAVPSFAGNSVEVIDDAGTVMNGTLAPIPSLRRDAAGMLEGRSYRMDAQSYVQTTAEATALNDPGTVRSVRTMRLVLSPVRWIAASKSIRLSTRMLVRVRYAPTATIRSSSGSVDDALRGMFVNENVAGQWSRPSTAMLRAPRSMSTGQEWARVTVQTNGIYRITAAQLTDAGWNVSAIDPATIQMFGLGGRELSEAVDSSTRPMREVAVSVTTTPAGKLDYLLFYGKGPFDWMYKASTRSYSHVLHHYDTVSSYMLTYGSTAGKRVRDTTAPTAQRSSFPTSFRNHVFREEENLNGFIIGGVPGSGREWFMTQVNPGLSASYQVLLDGYAGGTIGYSVAVGGHCTDGQSFEMFASDVSLGTLSVATTYSDVVLNRAHAAYTIPQSLVPADNRLPLRFQYSTTSAAGIGAVDNFEVHYDHLLQAAGDVLHFWSPDVTAAVEYSLRGFTSQPVVWDVTDDANITKMPVLNFSGTFATVDMDFTDGSPRELYAAAQNSFAAPIVQKMDHWADLRNTAGNADQIIITDRSVVDAANRLATYRSTGQFKSVVVATDDIYNEFSGGMRDVSAIRDFLQCAWLHGNGRLRYVLLFGDGSYDYKSDNTNLVPAYESTIQDAFNDIDSRATDDFYGCIAGNDSYVDLAIGRLCVRSQQEADNMVTKIIAYETKSDRTDWRNQITFVADDNFNPTGDDGTQFTDDAERLIKNNVPSTFDLRKIYEAQYTTVYAGVNNTGGLTKPGAYADVLDAYNSGTLVMSWIGHGNPHVWAHEAIFVNETSIPQLHNLSRLPFLTAATCDFGHFDNPREQCGTELLTLKPDGGTIGVLSTTRSVYDSYNMDVNSTFFTNLLSGRDNGLPLRVGDAFFRTKLHRFDLANDQKFYLQGDPAMRLLMPTGPVQIDDVNGINVLTDIAYLKAKMRVRINGTLRNLDSTHTLRSDFNGTADVTVYDSQRNDTVQSGPYKFGFALPGGVLYRGTNTVRNGKFSASFIVPKDIAYENKNGKITAYAVTTDGSDAVGSTTNIVVGGTDTSGVADTTGPTIKLFMDARTFQPGGFVQPEPLLIADLSDTSGLNASGTAIGHHIEGWVDNAVASIDLTSSYRGTLDDPTHGTAERILTGLAVGTHTVRVRAWDVFNNPTEATVPFVIPTSGSDLVIDNIMNVPNPFAHGTTFTLRQNKTVPLDVEIKIYTVAGRLIQDIVQTGVTQHLVTVPWDGLDRDGNVLGNGVYIYRVIVRTSDGTQQTEDIGRMAVLR